MNKRQKVNVLSKIRKKIRAATDAEFICNLFEEAIQCEGKPNRMSDIFPELADEIRRVGIENEGSHYWFPSALCYYADGKLLHLSNPEYNKRKLELISRVRKQLTGGKW